jgi:hypothetical protein
MAEDFHLLDLPSQATAVQRLLRGNTAEHKLEWLAVRGDLSRVAVTIPNARPTYRFVSSIGMECLFFIDEDEFVFIGDHTTYTGQRMITQLEMRGAVGKRKHEETQEGKGRNARHSVVFR